MNSLFDFIGEKGVMKLFETVSKAIGSLTTPKLIKMTADAKSYEIKK